MWPIITETITFFQSRNPGIKPRQSRDFGIGKVGRDPGIAIPTPASSDVQSLFLPRVKKTDFGRRAVSSAAPQIWNHNRRTPRTYCYQSLTIT